MSRRLSKKSRATKLATNVALSAANLPKLQSSVFDALFARSPARKPSLRASLLIGSALTAGFLVASLVNSSPAFAACTQSGDTITCTAGAYPNGIGPYFNEKPTPVEVINGTGVAITGSNGDGDGVTLNGSTLVEPTVEPSPFVITLDGTSSITGVSHDGIHMYSNYTGTQMSITNAASISAAANGRNAIYARIVDQDETVNDSIFISNSGALLPAGNASAGISAYILGNTSSTFSGADNTITIINTAQIGGAGHYTGGDGIYAGIKKYGGAGTPSNVDPKATASISNSKNIFSTNSSIHEIETVTDVVGGIAGAYSYVSNSGNLTSTTLHGIHAYAHAFTFGDGVATAGVSVQNSGTITAKNAAGYGILGKAYANTSYANPTLNVTGGTALATTSISNGGNITSGNEGIYGDAKARADNSGNFSKGGVGTGGSATAVVVITNTAAQITTGNQSAIDGNSYASATGHGYVGTGGNASATTTIANSGGNLTVGNGTTSPDASLSGFAKSYAGGYGQNLTAETKEAGFGGSAKSAVTISNTDAITSKNNPGIYGYSLAKANAGGSGHKNSYTDTGGNASATGSISNGGAIATHGTGIYGKAQAYAEAYAAAFGNATVHGVGTGGNATAGISITNSNSVTTSAADAGAISGFTMANAYAGGYTSKAGVATATTAISNTGALAMGNATVKPQAAVYGGAKSFAFAYGTNGSGGGTASTTGGTANAAVTITNAITGTISAKGDPGIVGVTYANASAGSYTNRPYVALGGTASAITSILNAATITVQGGGIFGGATEYAKAFGNLTAAKSTATGGIAPAMVSISNSGNMTSTGAFGIGGYASAGAGAIGFTAKGGTATATTSITNSGNLYTHHTGIYGAATALSDTWGGSTKGGSATGGTSSATVSISNMGNIYAGDGLSHQHIYGIYGNSFASASGGVIVVPFLGTGPNSLFPLFNAAYTAKGGTATATTTISNVGNLSVKGHDTEGIYGGSTAFAYANAILTKGGNATGGTATATTTVTNTGSVYNEHGSSIKAVSYANSKAHGYIAKGGTSTASTTVSNSGYLLSYHYTAIHAESYANADGKGNTTGMLPGPADKSSGTGGTASATVLITNIATAQAGGGNGDYANGIVGSSNARAVGAGYTAKGGTATAFTSITNSGAISSFDGSGIVGYAGSDANAFGNRTDAKGLAHAGTSSATVSITNTGAIISGTNGPDGIDGYSHAKAVGAGFHAYGGTAKAVTTIYNIGTITGDAGIYGFAKANAGAYGGNDVEPGKGVGGTATATTTISNFAAATIHSYGNGIDGYSFAKAEAHGRQAKGGTAIALTLINNAASIYSSGDGIRGNATANASGDGDTSIAGYGKGGIATATLSILNTGNISAGEDGILGFSRAYANGNGTGGTGGSATATTLITSAGGTILSYGAGIDGQSGAAANGSFGTGGKGGTANATTTILNSANIKTYGRYAPGIYAYSGAFADPPGNVSSTTGGNAMAMASVSNSGQILTLMHGSPGIAAYSYADANAGKGGNATAMTTVINTNTITTVGGNWSRPNNSEPAIPMRVTDFIGSFSGAAESKHSPFWVLGLKGSPGIVAGSAADSAGSASAMTLVTNTAAAAISTEGPVSPGIFAWSLAAVDATSSAYASTTVDNAAPITTLSWGSDGIVARSAAYGYGFTTNATAKTFVSNGGAITTFGGGSTGISAYSFAATDPSATTIVTNTGNITTFGHHAPGIYAGAVALAGLGGPSTATTDVYNNANIKTYGHRSDGIVAFTEAVSASGTASAMTLVSNGGTVVTTGRHSIGVYAYAGSGSVNPTQSKATIVIDNGNSTVSGLIKTTGSHSDAIYAVVVASKASLANDSITINNSFAGNATTPPSSIIANGGWHQFGYHAIVASGAPTTINNNGDIEGNVQLSSYNDTFNNNATGTWLMKGDSNFGSGVDVVNNAGLVKMDATASASRYSPDPATLGQATHVTSLYGLEVFNNNGGTVSMLNGAANDRIVITGPSSLPGGKVYFNGSGTSTLVVDAMLGGPPTTVTTKYHYSTTTTSGGRSTYVYGNFSAHGGSVSFSGPIGDGGNITVGFGGFSGNFSGNATTTVGYTSTTISGTGTRTYVKVGSSADVLQIGTKGSKGYAVGVTAIVVNDISPNLPGAYNPVGIPVVESNGAPNIVIASHTVGGVTIGGPANVAGNFFLANGPIQKGFFEYGLFYLPKTNTGPCQAGFNCWFLASTPSTAALQFTQLGTAANDIWSDAAGMWLDRNADLRDYFLMAGPSGNARGGGADLAVKAPIVLPPAGVGPGAWVRAYGDWIDNKQNATFSAFGTTLTSSVQYNQTIAGAQMGYDWAFMRTGFSAVLVGLMGGADGSTVNFGGGNKVTFQGGNAGAYATFLNHGFFVDSLFLANFMSMDYTAGGTLFGGGVPNTGVNANVQQYGGRMDAGYRFQFNPWFFEPQLTAEVVHSSFGNLPFPTVGTVIQVDDDTSVRGRLGGRLGTSFVTGNWRIEPSVTGGVWETLSGNNGAVLTSNGFALDLSDPSNNKTLGEVGGMLNFYQLGTNWSAFVKGDYRFASEYTSGSVKTGVRYQW